MVKFLRAMVVAVVFAGGLLLTPASPALAATGGGCGSNVSTAGLGYWKACISSPGPSSALPDGYFTLYAGHPSCTMQLSIWNSSNIRVWTGGQVPCPPGAASNGHYFANNPVYLANGTYRTGYEFFYSGTSKQAYSPTLTLP